MIYISTLIKLFMNKSYLSIFDNKHFRFLVFREYPQNTLFMLIIMINNNNIVLGVYS